MDSSTVLENKPGSYIPAVIAAFGGWTLDAFDFFLVVFCLTSIAKEFHKTDAQLALVITVTLMFRPIGAIIFGLMADRCGRRMPLMVNVGLFAVAEILTGFAPNYTILLVVRALFGVVMGGNWGVGASLAMEGVPTKKRGMVSGILQEGYAVGNVLAAVSFLFLFERLGWRPLFFLGSIPAILLVIFTRVYVRESSVWSTVVVHKPTWREQSQNIFSHWKLFLYLVVFMTMMLFSSHGTQDMYPTFLQRQWHLAPAGRSMITMIAGVGAISGGVFFGHLSDKLGRRRTIVMAFVLGILVIPVWVFAPSRLVLIAGAFLMQFAVQGAWGVVPVHLAELSHDSVRGFIPGFAYQTAGVIAGSVVYMEALYAQKTSYATAMALTAASAFVMASVVTTLGTEKRGQKFGGMA